MDLAERAKLHAALADPHRLAIVDALAGGDRTSRELAELVGAPSNLLAHHIAALEAAGVVERRVSAGDRRRRYVVLRPEALAGLVPPAIRLQEGLVLFVCTHNSARSQFAAALWSQRTGEPAESAGADPAPRVAPGAVLAARRRGVDLAGAVPKGYDAIDVVPALLVSVCDRAHEGEAPFAAPVIHWSVPDPVADGRPGAFDAAFGEIARRVDRLAAARAAA